MDEVLAVINAALGDGPASAPWAWTDDELQTGAVQVFAFLQRVTAAHLAIIREIDGRALPKRQGLTSTQWVSARHRISHPAAGRLLRLAHDLDGDDLAETFAALAAGDVNVEQAQAITDAVHDLPARHRAEGERRLLDEAEQSDRYGLRELAQRLLPELDPPEFSRREAESLRAATAEAATAEAATAKAEAAAQSAERRAHEARSLHFRDVPGTLQTKVVAVLDRTDAETLREAIDALCSPRRDRCASDDGAPLPLRTPRQLRADALMDLVRIALACGELPDNGGDRPQLTVTMSVDTLRADLREGAVADGASGTTLDDGSPISAATARRLACDAQILPVVLGGPSQILDVGKERRLFTGPLRRALVLRDGGCSFPGCTRPPRWCDGHHIKHWADGGTTSLDNAVLLCHLHHRLMHHGDWQVRLNPADRLPEFVPPSYVDAEQRVRRNSFHPGTFHPRT